MDSEEAIEVNLGAIGGATATGGDATGDQLSGIEDIIGTDHDDYIRGNWKDNVIEGGEGADYLDGAGGFDTLSYAGSYAGVKIDLQNKTASGGDASGDIFNGFEHAIGSDYDDVLITADWGGTLEGAVELTHSPVWGRKQLVIFYF